MRRAHAAETQIVIDSASSAGGLQSSTTSTDLFCPPVFRSAAVCGLFIVLSTFSTLYNKYILNDVFPGSNGLLLAQNFFSIVLLLLLRRAGIIRFNPRVFSWTDWITGVLYSVNVMTGLWSLKFVSIVMFGMLKRCTVVASFAIELFLLRRAVAAGSAPRSQLAATWRCSWPLAVMVLGTLLGGANDLTFNLTGYLLAMLSCVSQAASFEAGRHAAKASDGGIAGVLFTNSVVSLLLQTAMVIVTGEIAQLFDPKYTTIKVWLHFLTNGVALLTMNFSVFLNCYVNSPLAHAVTGNLKGVATTLFGVLVFVTPMSFFGWMGVMGNFTGAAWFSLVRMKKVDRPKQQDSSSLPSSSSLVATAGDGNAAATAFVRIDNEGPMPLSPSVEPQGDAGDGSRGGSSASFHMTVSSPYVSGAARSGAWSELGGGLATRGLRQAGGTAV